MIAVWIVAACFISVGLFTCVPRYYKFIRCKGRTAGRIVQTASSHGADVNAIRASYEYTVDGKTYRRSTGWTNYAVLIAGRECEVRYDLKNPRRSYMKRSGQLMKCAIGTLFTLTGIAASVVGIILKTVLGLS